MASWKDWVPDQAVEELTLMRALAEVEDPVKMAGKLFTEALPLAVMGMTHLAIHSPDERTRFSAQKYVIDRAMGTTQNPTKPIDDRPVWERIFDSIAVEADNLTGKSE